MQSHRTWAVKVLLSCSHCSNRKSPASHLPPPRLASLRAFCAQRIARHCNLDLGSGDEVSLRKDPHPHDP